MKLSTTVTYLPIVWQARKLLLFLRYFIAALFRYRKWSLTGSTVRNFPKWWKTVRRDNNILEYDQPWIVFDAKRFLDTLLNPDMTVWEYGSGSSTLYFSRRVKQIFSVENDRNWFAYLQNIIREKQIDNVMSQLFENDDDTIALRSRAEQSGAERSRAEQSAKYTGPNRRIKFSGNTCKA